MAITAHPLLLQFLKCHPNLHHLCGLKHPLPISPSLLRKALSRYSQAHPQPLNLHFSLGVSSILDAFPLDLQGSSVPWDCHSERASSTL